MRQSTTAEPTEDVQGLFDRTARTYDFLNHLFSFNIDSAWRRRLVERSGAGDGTRILDVCTGTGDVALHFARHVPGCRVIGLDFAQHMIDKGTAKAARSGLADRVQFVGGDALRLPYPDESFDVACNSFGLRTIPDRESAVREMTRIVRPGGRVLVMEFLPPPRTFFGALYSFHLNTLMPLLGGLLSGFRASYTYLSDTVAAFPPAEHIRTLMEGTGLSEAGYDRLTGGIAYLFYGTKGAPASGAPRAAYDREDTAHQ